MNAVLAEVPDAGENLHASKRLRSAKLLGKVRHCWLVLTVCVATTGLLADDTQRMAADQKRLSPAVEATLAAHLKDAFDAGQVIGARHLQEALSHLGLARRVAPDDPRVEFSYGLVLLKQMQVAAAIARFDAACKLDQGRYWPAWQGAIWGHFLDKQFDLGFEKLIEYARIVQATERWDETSGAQRHAARWIGQLVEALSLRADSEKRRDQIAEHEAQLLKVLGDELSLELEAGRQSIRERAVALEEAADASRRAVGSKQKRRLQEKESKLEQDIESIDKVRVDDKKTAEEWKGWLDETLAKADKQLGLLERDYNFLDQRAASLMQSFVIAGQEITALKVQSDLERFPWRRPGLTDFAQRQNQMLGYQLEYNATVGRMHTIAQQGSLVLEQRALAVQQYQKATGQLVQKGAHLDKWATRLKNEKQKLAAPKSTVKANAKMPVPRKHEFSLNS
ncbi:MAG: hypothetical protein JSS02_28805, partial [Planctomycetes bacterium]|nr:hypothetical protein [Planctomycetota bacterium]